MENSASGRVPLQPKQRETDHQLHWLDLEFRGVKIALLSGHKIPMENFKELENDVTGMETKGSDCPSVPDGNLVYIPAEEVDVQYRPKEKALILKGPTRLFGSGSTLAYMAQYMAECLRTSKSGLMLIHAAAVRSPIHNTSYIILGEKGAGKTTLALRLCHQCGYRLIGNDQIFLGPKQDGTLVTEGGNAWFSFRETAILADAYLAQLLPHVHDSTKAAWNNKIRVDPSQIGIAIATGESLVKSVLHIRIDHAQSALHIKSWKGVQRNLVLHERFGRHISGQATPFQDDRGNYLGSLPSINLDRSLKARDELVSFVNKMGVMEIFVPDSSSAVDFITKLE